MSGSGMAAQSGFHCGSIRAVRTRIGFLPCVNPQVLSEVILVVEVLVAMVADEAIG